MSACAALTQSREGQPLRFKYVDCSFARIHSAITGPLFFEQGKMLDIEPMPWPYKGGTFFEVCEAPVQGGPADGLQLLKSSYTAWLPGEAGSVADAARYYRESFGRELTWSTLPDLRFVDL